MVSRASLQIRFHDTEVRSKYRCACFTLLGVVNNSYIEISNRDYSISLPDKGCLFSLKVLVEASVK
jgi:hypothetical protein